MGGIGALRTRRSSVAALAGNRRWAASLDPACPPRAMPIARRTAMSQVVLRADGATSSGTRSVKMRRAQVGWRHTNFRTVS
jgi:hypothetical protein